MGTATQKKESKRAMPDSSRPGDSNAGDADSRRGLWHAIRSFFDVPTIEGLAREIEMARASGTTPRLRAIRPRHQPKLDTLAAELAKLSPAEIDRLLQQMRGI
jgi:hypothetical protein